MHGTALIPQASIAEIVRKRNEAIDLYERAYMAMVDAEKAVLAADQMSKAAAPMTHDGRYSYHLKETIEKFRIMSPVPDREFYLATARRVVDTCCWQYIIKLTNLEMIMDTKAKEELHQSMMEKEPDRRSAYQKRDDPFPVANPNEFKDRMPEITEETIRATLEQYARDAGMIFQRGVVNTFTRLDRRFRSHDGFKIGNRIIFTYAFDDWGHWNYSRHREDTIIDVERTLRLLDNQPITHRYASIVQAIDNDRRGASGARQSEHESEYFTIRIFKNGNAHMWFKRKDLLEKINRTLADYYGEVIGDNMTEGQEEDPFENVKTTPARYFGFYPTPDAAADHFFGYVPLGRHSDSPRYHVLEPSAGTGQLARRALADGVTVDCCEVQAHLAEALSTAMYRKVYNQDFMALSPTTTDLYSHVIMNPPFDRERDIDHVVHAMKFLEPGGCLVAIMSSGTEFRETRKAIAFRELVEKKRGKWFDMPLGSFSEVGTNVNTVIVKFFNDGRDFWH